MKLLLLLQLLAILLGALCITHSTAVTSSSFSRDDRHLRVLQQLSVAEAQSLLVEEQEDRTALAQLFLHMGLLENEVQKQDMNDGEKAEMEAILSRLRKFFTHLGHTIGKGFKRFGQTVKEFFNNRH